MTTTARWRRLAAAALTALLVAPVHAETLKEQVKRLERELNELKAEMHRRDAAAAGAPAPAAGAPTAVAPAAAAPPSAVVAAPPASAPPTTATAAAEENGIGRSALGAITERVHIGGYGSFRYEGSDLAAQKHTFTFRRFVLTADANIAPRLRGYMELEFERFRKLEVEKTMSGQDGNLAAEQALEATNESEISFEQAWLQYDLWRQYLSFRGGAVLVPLGRFNLNHDDNRWDLPRRSLVDRGVPVLPSTAAWDEVGLGFVGQVPIGDTALLDYQTYVVNGVALNAEFEHIAAGRRGDTTLSETEVKVSPDTGTFGSDVKDGKAWTGRVAMSPWLGHEIGGSWYWGQYTPDFLSNEDVWSLAGDWKGTWGPFELEGEYVFTQWNGIERVARSLAQAARRKESAIENGQLESEVEFELAGLAHSKQGYWLEGRYRFWPKPLSDTFLGRGFANPQFVAVARGEQVWMRGLVDQIDFVGGQLTHFGSENRYVNRLTAGIAFRPVPLVVFQLAYEYTWTNGGKSLGGVTNYLPAGVDEDSANTILLGAAFGF